VLNGAIGHILIKDISRDRIDFTFTAVRSPPPLAPVHVICGLSRPQQAKRILRDCTSMGAASIWFSHTELGQKSYRDSPIWQNDGWLIHVIDGLEQSGGTLMPEIKLFTSIKSAVLSLPKNLKCIILDNEDSRVHLRDLLDNSDDLSRGIALVIGSERGWTDMERRDLSDTGFQFGYLGDRILRTDTACISATALALASLYRR